MKEFHFIIKIIYNQRVESILKLHGNCYHSMLYYNHDSGRQDDSLALLCFMMPIDYPFV